MPLILLEREVIRLFLSVRKHPLLHLLLVPVHLHLVLIHLLVALEDLVLEIIEPLLDVDCAVIECLEVLIDAPDLAFVDLLEMVLRLDLLVLLVDEGLGVKKLGLDVLEMLVQDLYSVVLLLDLLLQLLGQSPFLFDLCG